jgi:shikimate kinase
MVEPCTQRIIVLVGPKHSGKSSVGRALARLTHATLYDLDEVIQEHSGKSPRELYLESPERFRTEEAAAARQLVQLADGKNTGTCIIAAGGGLSDNPEALDTLSSRGCLVYLEVSAETAWNRIAASAARTGELPPFLRTENPRETHRILHERRALIYTTKADIRVDASTGGPKAIASRLFYDLKLANRA